MAVKVIAAMKAGHTVQVHPKVTTPRQERTVSVMMRRQHQRKPDRF